MCVFLLLLFVYTFDKNNNIHIVLGEKMFSVCLQQRYGFELTWIAGRACDINRNSTKLPGKKQMFYNMLGYQS